jgi:sigma-B regulation protein RsbU (phosphoserine phosphatase)
LHTGLVMLMIQSIVAATTLARPDATPGTAWSALNHVLHDNVRRRLHRDEHATLTLLRYHEDGRLEFAGAHEDLIIYRAADRTCELVSTPGLWAGIHPDPPPGSVVEGECQLRAGDVLLLYTDGLIESRHSELGAFGVPRVCQSLVEVADRPVEEILDHILGQLHAWTTRQRDDITLVVLRYTA